jgi:hypothetical protein
MSDFKTDGHPDEVVQPVNEEPSTLVAEAQLRHEFADTDYATAQEKKQAAVEQAHSMGTRPDGSYAQLHETDEPTLAVADEAHGEELRQRQADVLENIQGAEPVGSPAGQRREEDAARARAEAASESGQPAAPDTGEANATPDTASRGEEQSPADPVGSEPVGSDADVSASPPPPSNLDGATDQGIAATDTDGDPDRNVAL